ncbi:hypothetical protein I543_5212 [Mycobacteroides abscessus 21]|uniref:Uncharacterized protein n=1 Tax=Mycobacteroides abscessus 21 TaxID=1299324 RepID=A0A829Q7J2_9MYCO|nr:hypothetical protein I543_5212 [Mycobacteroides abscessus 21]
MLDIDALTLAFRALLRSYPVLATQIVSAGHEYVLHHVPHPPALQVGTCTALPPQASPSSTPTRCVPST